MIRKRLLSCFAAGVMTLAFGTAALAQEITVFSGPVTKYDAVWMAEANGFYEEEGLDIQFRDFPSGTTALLTFLTGQGDIVFNGDLPGVRPWLHAYRSKSRRVGKGGVRTCLSR